MPTNKIWKWKYQFSKRGTGRRSEKCTLFELRTVASIEWNDGLKEYNKRRRVVERNESITSSSCAELLAPTAVTANLTLALWRRRRMVCHDIPRLRTTILLFNVRSTEPTLVLSQGPRWRPGADRLAVTRLRSEITVFLHRKIVRSTTRHGQW